MIKRSLFQLARPEPQELAQFLGSSAPRRVPSSVQRAALRAGAPLIFPLFGLIAVAIGVATMPGHLPQQRELAERGATSLGEITRVDRIGGKKRIFWHAYVFKLGDGAPRVGASYTTGSGWRVGERVPVRYLAEDPTVSCIEGARMDENDWPAAAFTGGSGIALIVGWFIARQRRLWLLENGRITRVTITGVLALKRVKGREVHRLALRWPNDSVTSIDLRGDDHGPWARACCDEKRPVAVLHHPDRPARGVLPETW